MLLAVSGFFMTTGCAQQKAAAQKSYLFYRINLPGNIPVDEQGNPEQKADTVYQAYLVTKKPAPSVAYAIISGKRYEVLAVEVEEVLVGKTATGNKNVLLTAQRGYTILQLELQAVALKANSTGNKLAVYNRTKKIQLLPMPRAVALQPEEHY